MRIIFYTAVSIFIANCTVFSNSPDDYYLCYFQGVFQQFFYPASWIWTTILSYLIYCLVMFGKIEMEELSMHLIGWGIPFLTTVLPLTTSTYSKGDDDGFCWIEARDGLNDWTTFWQVLTFGCIAFTCTVCMVYWGALMFRKIKIEKSECSPAVINAMNTLFIYPVIIVVCWLPEAIQATFSPGYSAGSHVVVGVNSFAIAQGGVSAIAFFVNSKETRYNWINLAAKVCPICAQFITPQTQQTEVAPDRPTLFYAGDEEDFEEDSVYKSESLPSGQSRISMTSFGEQPTVSPLSGMGASQADEQL